MGFDFAVCFGRLCPVGSSVLTVVGKSLGGGDESVILVQYGVDEVCEG